MLARFRLPVGPGELLKRTAKEVIADDVLSLAAQQAYYFFFALFPALLALLSIASFFPVANLVEEIVVLLRQFAPPDVVDIVAEQIEKISDSRRAGVLTFAFLFTLWSSSNALMSMVNTLNAAYDITDSRPWWKTRLLAIALTVGLAVFILVSMTLIIAGPSMAESLARHFGLGAAFEWTWKIAQWPIVLLLVATAIALVYYFAPDAKQDWVWITPGSLVATLLWLAVSLGLKAYLSVAGNYNETYGAIGSVMVLMLWFYLSGFVILLGAELNSEIEHASPYGKKPGERVAGEKKQLTTEAEREYERRRRRGEVVYKPFAEGTNCDIERVQRPPDRGLRPSELLIGAAALLPVALKIGRDVKRRVDENGAGNRAA